MTGRIDIINAPEEGVITLKTAKKRGGFSKLSSLIVKGGSAPVKWKCETFVNFPRSAEPS